MIDPQHLSKPTEGPAPRWFHIAVAASMVISAVSALIATVHTGRTMTALVEQNAKLVRASSTPILEFGHGNVRDDGSSSLEFVLRNVGSGLARVVWLELRLDGKVMPDMRETIRVLSPDANTGLSIATGTVAPRVFAPGAEQRILGWPKPPASDAPLLDAWKAVDRARFNRISVEACYCSVFQECWTSHLNGDVPRPVAACSGESRTSLRG